MAEFLVDENNSLWSQVLYGISGGDGEIVTVALSQVGNIGGEPCGSWYGFDSRVEGVPALLAGVPTSAAILKLASFRSLQPAHLRVCRGSRSADCGRTTAMSHDPATLSFSIGMMEVRTVLPIMLALWRRWRMAVSTLSRGTLAIPSVKTVTRLVTMKSMGMEPRLIN